MFMSWSWPVLIQGIQEKVINNNVVSPDTYIGKPLKWSGEARRGSQHLSLSIKGKNDQLDSNRRILNRKRITSPNRKRCNNSYKKTDYSSNQPLKNCHPPKLLLLSNGLSLTTTPPIFPFLHKIMLFSFVCGICLWFAIACMSWIAVLCYFWINPFFW